MEILIPTTIRKDQIEPFGKMNGHANSVPVVIDGQSVKVGSVMFRYFDWQTFGANKTFSGQLVFTTDVPDGAPSADLNALFDTKNPATKKVRAANVNNDV